MRYVVSVLSCSLVGAFAVLPASAAFVTSTWIGGPSGTWSAAANWSPNGAPANGGGVTYDVIIDASSKNAAAVTLDFSPQIMNLTIGSGDSLMLGNSTALFLAGGSLANDGQLVMSSLGNLTDLRLDTDVTLSGSGAVNTTNTQANRLYGANGSLRLTNGLGHTIHGAMQFGLNQTRLTNHGLFDADLSAGVSFDLVDAAGTNFNDGTIRASNGATLFVYPATFENDGGVIEAAAGSIVHLQDLTVNGGTLRDADGDGPGRVESGGQVILDHVAFDGPFTLANSTTLALRNDAVVPDRIACSSVGNFTDLRFDTSPFTLLGGGSITTTNTQANRIFTAAPPMRLLVPADFTIRGAMQLGVNQTRLTNHGLVDADLPAGMSLDLTDGAGMNVNDGTIRASNGATLTVYPATFDNDGGVIEAAPGSFVHLQDLTINGGTLRDADGDGPGTISNSGLVYLDHVTLDGPYLVTNSAAVAMRNDVVIPGHFDVGATGNFTDLRFDTSPYTLLGGGSITTTNTQANRLYTAAASMRLVVPADFTIRGAMQLGVNQTRLTNHGLIATDLPAGMSLDLVDGAGMNVNDGTIRASNGATLTIYPATFDNDGGLIEAAAGSFVHLQDLTINGGTLRDADGGGPGEVGTIGAVYLDHVTLEGTLKVPNAGALILRNGITIGNRIDVGGSGNFTDVRVETTPFLLGGGGELVFSNSPANRLYSAAPSITIVNGAGNTIRGSFQLGVNQTILQNDGAIIADASGGVEIDLVDGFQSTNNGTIWAKLGNITLWPSNLVNSGTIRIDAGRSFLWHAAYPQLAGATIANGSLQLDGQPLHLYGGELRGNGTVIGSLVHNELGTVDPGDQIGTLTLTNGYLQGANATLAVEIGGTAPGVGHDQLKVIGTATIAGTLHVERANGFMPLPGDNFTILSASGPVVGFFDAIDSCDDVTVLYGDHEVIVYFSTAIPSLGDLDGDGSVNATDLAILLGSWGPCTASCCSADLDGNGDVGASDLAILLGGWN